MAALFRHEGMTVAMFLGAGMRAVFYKRGIKAVFPHVSSYGKDGMGPRGLSDNCQSPWVVVRTVDQNEAVEASKLARII